MAVEAIANGLLGDCRSRITALLVCLPSELFIGHLNLSVPLEEGLHDSLSHEEPLPQILLRQVV